MRKKLVGFVVAAFVAVLVASPALAKQLSGDGRAGSTIIARN
jgi:hypothetical protein